MKHLDMMQRPTCVLRALAQAGSTLVVATVCVWSASALAQEPQCTGTGIEGVVRDAATAETLIEAPVIVVGRGTRVLTDFDGNFAIDVPPGTYSLRSYYDLYQPTRVDEIEVTRGRCTRVELELAPESAMGEEVVIEVRAVAGSSASQLRVRREATATQDAISSEEMSRSPDSSAGDAARRAVGVTIRDDYLYVRGLGGRYVVTLLNGVALPNTDPDVPGVQLDIFPAGLLESLTIRKTFTADVPGDWAGGLLDIQTQSFPTELEVRVGASIGLNTALTFGDTWAYTGGGTDFLGFDDGTRSIPSAVQGPISELTNEERDATSLAFSNRWALGTRTSLPPFSLSGSIGDTLDVAGHVVGYRLMVGYGYGESTVADEVRSVRLEGVGDDQRVTEREVFRQTGVQLHYQLAALGSVTVELAPRNQLTLTGLFSQNADDTITRLRGRAEDTATAVDAWRLNWVQRTMGFAQLLGEHHDLPAGARFDWQLNVSHGQRLQPDLRDVLYTIAEDGTRTWAPGPASGARFYSDLEDVTYGGGGVLTIPIDTLTLRLGGLLRRTDRGLAVRRFNWSTRSGSSAADRRLPIDQIFGEDLLNQVTRLREVTRGDDSYSATQTAYAAFASVEWAPIPELRFVAGVRGEGFRQTVESASPFDSTGEDAPPGTRRTDVDAMPSISAVLEVAPDMFVRASYGGTVGRPQVRELAPFVFVDFVRRRTITGNPELLRTYIHNFDLRWEWFPSATDVLAVSAFAKVFESPIEQTIVASGGDLSFANIAGAENYGLELESRFSFGHFAPELDWIGLGANITVVYSVARLTPEQQAQATSSDRPLAGQPPYVINLSLAVSPPDTGLSFNVYYNVFGPRLEDVGRLGIPDVYFEPFHDLAATISWTPIEQLTVRLAARNILFQRQEFRQGDFVVLGRNPGATFTLGLSGSF